jgi:hypothetical protein
MEDHSRMYGLTFIPGEGRVGPKIAFVLDAVRAKLFETELRKTFAEVVDPKVPFVLFDERGRFGYGSCGERIERDREVLYAFELVRLDTPQARNILSDTISAIFLMLSAEGDTIRSQAKKKSNLPQLLEINFGVSRDGDPGVGGWLLPVVCEWLEARGRELPPQKETRPFSDEYYSGYPYKDDSIAKAMAEAWRTTTPENMHDFAENCRMTLTSEGRFKFACLGANVAMFPDLASTVNEGLPVQFSCWNLDSSWQQLTMLAGLAALHDVLVKDLG